MKRRSGSGGVDVASGNIRRVYFVSKKQMYNKKKT
jgi:hypothetical protein